MEYLTAEEMRELMESKKPLAIDAQLKAIYNEILKASGSFQHMVFWEKNILPENVKKLEELGYQLYIYDDGDCTISW